MTEHAEPEHADLRRPDRDETALSTLEVRQGLRDGSIPSGPHARARAFADVWVWERQRVEVWQIGEAA